MTDTIQIIPNYPFFLPTTTFQHEQQVQIFSDLVVHIPDYEPLDSFVRPLEPDDEIWLEKLATLHQ